MVNLYLGGVARRTSDDMLEAAGRLLATDGPGALSARRVAAAVGTSTMAVYSGFGGMPGLMATLATEGFRRLGEAMGAVGATADPWAGLGAMAWAYRDVATSDPNRYELMFGRSGLEVVLSGDQQAVAMDSFDKLVAGVARCRPDLGGGVTEASVSMWAGVHGAVTLELFAYRHMGIDGRRAFAAALEVLAAGLAHLSPPEPGS